MRKMRIAALGSALGLTLGGIAWAQGYVTVTSMNSADLIEVQQSTGPQHQYVSALTLANFARTLGTAVATVPLGGSGAATFTAHGVLVGEGTSAFTPLAVGTTGQLLQGATGADPGWATTLTGNYILGGTLVTFGNAAGAPTHIATAQTTAPALTSCGTGSPAITGTDEAGVVTMGTNATGCVITFNVAYTGTPFCVVSWIATPLASQSYVTANTAITTTQTSASGNKLQYICRAPAGG